MPVKKRTAKKPLVESKASAKQAVKQVVNVRIGEKTTTRRRRVARVPKMPPAEPSPLLRRTPPINLSLSTQTYNQPPVQPFVNEYNMLLRQLAEERTARARAAPPLQPNTAPLTTNLQRNELLSRREPMPTAQAFPVVNIMDEVVNKKLYDDPLTNENMFVNSSRLAENLAPKLPVSNFNYDDLNKYADENLDEQDAVTREVVEEAKKLLSPQKKYYDEMSRAYEDYVNYLRDMNERYGINEAPKSRRTLNSKVQIKREVDRIQNIVMELVPRKAGKG